MTPEQVEIAHLKQQVVEMKQNLLIQLDGFLARLNRIAPPLEKGNSGPRPKTKEQWRKFLDKK